MPQKKIYELYENGEKVCIGYSEDLAKRISCAPETITDHSRSGKIMQDKYKIVCIGRGKIERQKEKKEEKFDYVYHYLNLYGKTIAKDLNEIDGLQKKLGKKIKATTLKDYGEEYHGRRKGKLVVSYLLEVVNEL